MYNTDIKLEQLIRDSERLQIVKDFVKKGDRIIIKKDLAVLLGIEVESDAD